MFSENYLLFSSMYHSKMIRHILKNMQKAKCVFNEIIRKINMKMKMKSISHRYDVNIGLEMDTNTLNIKIVTE